MTIPQMLIGGDSWFSISGNFYDIGPDDALYEDTSAYNGSVYIIFSRSYKYPQDIFVHSSQDGITWVKTFRPEIALDSYQKGSKLSVVGNKFVVVDKYCTCHISIDGINWSSNEGLSSALNTKISYENITSKGGNKIIVVSRFPLADGTQVTKYATSLDGITWVNHGNFTQFPHYETSGALYYAPASTISWVKDKFIALSGNINPGKCAISLDGINWVTYTTPPITNGSGQLLSSNIHYDTVSHANGVILIHSSVYGYSAVSNDGITWISRPELRLLYGTTFFRMVVCGGFNIFFASISLSRGDFHFATSLDGIVWERIINEQASSLIKLNTLYTPIIVGNDRFVIATTGIVYKQMT